MDRTVSYNGVTERRAFVAEYEAQGFRMMSDNFAADWQPGDAPRGVMVFTDVHPPDPPKPPAQLARESRRALLTALRAKGSANWTTKDVQDAVAALVDEIIR